MRNLNLLFSLCSIAVLVVVCVGCGSTDQGGGSRGAGDERAYYPQWFWEEGGVYKDETEGGYIIYTVGMGRLARGKMVPMTRTAAKQQAMGAMADVLCSHVQKMVTAYAERAGDYYDPDTFSDTEHVESISRNLSEAYISGAVLVNSFVASPDEQFAVLMRLNLQSSELLAKAKKAMRENYADKMKVKAEKALGKMDEAFAAQDARVQNAPNYESK
jgi:hypothetical protein